MWPDFNNNENNTNENKKGSLKRLKRTLKIVKTESLRLKTEDRVTWRDSMEILNKLQDLEKCDRRQSDWQCQYYKNMEDKMLQHPIHSSFQQNVKVKQKFELRNKQTLFRKHKTKIILDSTPFHHLLCVSAAWFPWWVKLTTCNSWLVSTPLQTLLQSLLATDRNYSRVLDFLVPILTLPSHPSCISGRCQQNNPQFRNWHERSAFQSVGIQVVDWHNDSEPLFSLFFSLFFFSSFLRHNIFS